MTRHITNKTLNLLYIYILYINYKTTISMGCTEGHDRLERTSLEQRTFAHLAGYDRSFEGDHSTDFGSYSSSPRSSARSKFFLYILFTTFYISYFAQFLLGIHPLIYFLLIILNMFVFKVLSQIIYIYIYIP